MRELRPLALVFLVGLLLVPPLARFPLNDEWLFRAMVDTLVSGGGYVHHPYVQPTSVALVAWGAIFESMFGPGLPTLRLSVAPLALLAAWATVQCARVCGIGRVPALLCGVVLLVNPVSFNLSSAFMTDMPSVALATLSAWFYLRALRGGGTQAVLLGTVAAAIGFFVRQNAVFPAIAFALVSAGLGRASSDRAQLWTAPTFAAFLLPWVPVAVGFNWWSQAGGGGGDWISPRTIPWIVRLLWLPGYAVDVACTVGLFLAPLALPRLMSLATRRAHWGREAWALFVTLCAVFGSAFLFLYRGALPRIGNILDFYSMGPRVLFGQPELGAAGMETFTLAWRLATVLGVVSAAVIGVSAWQVFAPSRPEGGATLPFDRRQGWFLALWAGGVFITSYSPLTVQPMDRYLIPLVILGAIVLARAGSRNFSRSEIMVAGALVLALFGYSIGMQHDYLSWNDARWKAGEGLMSRGVPAAEIDGGYEFNGVLKSAEYVRLHGPRPFWLCLEDTVWWRLRDRYRLAFSPLSGHTVLGRVGYASWLGGGEQFVYVLAMPESGS